MEIAMTATPWSPSMGPGHYSSSLSFVDKDLLEPGSSLRLSCKVRAVMGVLMDDDPDPLITVMKVEKAPQETRASTGGLHNHIRKLRNLWSFLSAIQHIRSRWE